MGFPGGSVVKNLPAMQETRVRSLGQEDPLEKGMATHCSTLAWRIMDRGAWRATVHGVTKIPTRLKRLSTHTCRNLTKLTAMLITTFTEKTFATS